MNSKKMIGLIGGLGPLAGNDVVAKLFDYAASSHGAVKDNEYPNILLMSQGLSDFDETGHISPFFEKDILSVVDAVELHQPDLMAIACNTAHIFAGSVRKHTAARFINIIEATVEEAARHECQYLILSSSTTRKTGLYNDALLKKKIDFLDIDDSEQKIVDQIISLVMYNKIFEASTLADEFIEGLLIKYTKVKGVIAGCTELPLALSHASLKEKLTIIDCNTALAKKLADEYYAQRLE